MGNQTIVISGMFGFGVGVFLMILANTNKEAKLIEKIEIQESILETLYEECEDCLLYSPCQGCYYSNFDCENCDEID